MAWRCPGPVSALHRVGEPPRPVGLLTGEGRVGCPVQAGEKALCALTVWPRAGPLRGLDWAGTSPMSMEIWPLGTTPVLLRLVPLPEAKVGTEAT